MGLALARRLLSAGHDVLVYNRTKAKAEPLAGAGAKIVDQASDLARARVVFVMVGTSEDLVTALLGPAGLMSGPDTPGIVVDLSTVSVEASGQVRQTPHVRAFRSGRGSRRSRAVPGRSRCRRQLRRRG
jgi:3-hydroxyisobutyrate dehydrogenase-like beta-hydroxyacid dehydrogenase